jgi:hypothetical protein
MTNRKLLRRSLALMCGLICLTPAYATQTGAMAGRPNFTGTWRLNRELSDKPQEKVKEAIGKKGGALGRMMGGRAAQDRMKSIEALAEVLRIVHNDPEFQVTGNNNVSRQLFSDGRKVSATTPKGESVETTARWQGSQLVVVTQRANGGKLIQTYTLDRGAGQMIISMQITGQRLDRPIELRFVYDAEAGR